MKKKIGKSYCQQVPGYVGQVVRFIGKGKGQVPSWKTRAAYRSVVSRQIRARLVWGNRGGTRIILHWGIRGSQCATNHALVYCGCVQVLTWLFHNSAPPVPGLHFSEFSLITMRGFFHILGKLFFFCVCSLFFLVDPAPSPRFSTGPQFNL